MRARRPCSGGWTCLVTLMLLAASAPAPAQEPPFVAPGDRVRLWTVAPFAPGEGTKGSAVARLLRAGPDTLEVHVGQAAYLVPRSAITHVELSQGHPHRGRHAGYGFAGTLAAGTVASALVSSTCRNDSRFLGPGFCFGVLEFYFVLPASCLGALVGALVTPERFGPASLPPPEPK